MRITARERECLLWAARGKTYYETAIILGLSHGTIKTYLDNARLKIDAANLTHAVAIALVSGIIQPEEIKIMIKDSRALHDWP